MNKRNQHHETDRPTILPLSFPHHDIGPSVEHSTLGPSTTLRTSLPFHTHAATLWLTTIQLSSLCCAATTVRMRRMRLSSDLSFHRLNLSQADHDWSRARDTQPPPLTPGWFPFDTKGNGRLAHALNRRKCCRLAALNCEHTTNLELNPRWVCKQSSGSKNLRGNTLAGNARGAASGGAIVWEAVTGDAIVWRQSSEWQ